MSIHFTVHIDSTSNNSSLHIHVHKFIDTSKCFSRHFLPFQSLILWTDGKIHIQQNRNIYMNRWTSSANEFESVYSAHKQSNTFDQVSKGFAIFWWSTCMWWTQRCVAAAKALQKPLAWLRWRHTQKQCTSMCNETRTARIYVHAF